MSKQTFRLRNNLILNILFSFSSVTLTLFGFLIVSPLISESTHAEGDEPDDGITVVANNNIEINLLSTDQGYYKIAKDTVTVSTGSEYGYTLYLSTDSAAHQSIYLNGDTSSESKISGTTGTYESPAALADEGYSWGWAVPGISHFDNTYDTTNPDTKSKFAVMPLENKIIHEYTTEATEDTTDVYYGFKLEGTLEPGEYETAISYTAVSADAPLVARAILGDNGNLNFVYDRNTYTAGETYMDNIGETTITNVYEVPMNSVGCAYSTKMPWYDQRDSVTKINIDDSFVNAAPTGACGWFNELRKVSSITNLQNLTTDNVVDTSFMFRNTGYYAATFSMSGLDDWNTSNVTNMLGMFISVGRKATNWDIGSLSTWDTGSVVDMDSMFYYAGYNATTFDIGDIGGWNTSNVANMFGMFGNAGCFATIWNIGDLSNWNTSSVTDMSYMFQGAGSENTITWNIGNLGYIDEKHSGWDTSSVIDMQYMFSSAGYNATTWNIGDLSSWDTSNVTNMSYMFHDAGHNATIFSIGNIGNWNTRNVANMEAMFSNAGYTADTWNLGDLSGWDTSNVTNMNFMFQDAGLNATYWNIGDLSGWAVSKDTQHYQFINLNTHQSNASVVNNQPNWN